MYKDLLTAVQRAVATSSLVPYWNGLLWINLTEPLNRARSRARHQLRYRFSMVKKTLIALRSNMALLPVHNGSIMYLDSKANVAEINPLHQSKYDMINQG